MTSSAAPPLSSVAESGSGLSDVLEEQARARAKSGGQTGQTFIRAEPLPPDAASSGVTARPDVPSVSASAVLGESATMPEGTPECRGYDFNRTLPPSDDREGESDGPGAGGKEEEEEAVLDGLMAAMRTTGFQATALGSAVDEIDRMRSWRLSDVPFREGLDDPDLRDPSKRSKIRARIFLSYTSNQISSGQREVIRFLVQHGMVDVLVTTAGGIEEDIIKCFEPTYMGDFKLRGRDLRRKGINRIGNLLVPNNNYCKFEDWLAPLLVRMHDEQDESWLEWARDVAAGERDECGSLPPKFAWTPSKVIERLGREIDDESSVLHWASRNSVPVFCPALTDGSVGDMMYFHSYKRPGLILDIAEDVRAINDLAVRSHATGMIILGGGLVKHHTCNANLMRNGADFSVYVNTAHEFDGSDSGASPEEAVSWGKIRMDASPVKVCCDATIAFPLIVSQTFARDVRGWRERTRGCVCWADDGAEEGEAEKN